MIREGKQDLRRHLAMLINISRFDLRSQFGNLLLDVFGDHVTNILLDSREGKQDLKRHLAMLINIFRFDLSYWMYPQR